MKPERIDAILKNQARIALTSLPTPLTVLRQLSRAYGQRIYCKRDDLTGFAFGGSKTRKLEYLFAEAQQKHADTVVAVGAVQSNFCRVAAAAAAQMNMDCHLVLGGKMPRQPSANVVLDELLRAQIKFSSSEDWNDWEEAQDLLVEDLQAEGRRVYSMPLAGSNEVGLLGYVAAMAELLRDFEDIGDSLQHLVLASSSGGMQAGLLVGKVISAWPGQIWGVSVAYDKVSLANEIYDLASRLGKRFAVRIDPRDIFVDDSFVAPGFAQASAQTLQAIERMACDEGLFVDRCYSGKAAAALLSYLDEGRFSSSDSLCFLHSGGAVELFA